MPASRSLAATLAVALLLTASGCAAFQGGGTADGDAIADRTVAALDGVDSYTYASTVTVTDDNSSTSVDISGAVDRADRRLRFEQSSGGESASQYVINDTVYANTSNGWVTRTIDAESFWSAQLPVAEQRSILANATVTFEGNTTIDGTDVYELSVDVSDSQLRGYLRQRLGVVSPEVTFSNVTYTAYVTHENDRLKRVTSETTASFNNQSADVDATMSIDGYGENVTIELPPAATE